MAEKKLAVVITGDASDAKKAFSTVGDSADGLTGKLSGLGSKISPGLAAAATAVVAGVGLMMKSAFDAAEESAKIGRETERVLRTTGATAWISAGQVSDYAGELSNLTGVDDELIQSGENLLLTFTQVQNKIGSGNDVFDRATAAALDMSTALGTDMSGSAIQVGKALQDPIRGLTALRRVGVAFNDQQQEQIRTMVAAGDTLGAQKVILAELEKEFGGAAAAAATPLDRLKVQIDNLMESLGSALIPVVGAAADVLSNLVTGFTALPGPVQTGIVALGGLAAAGSGAVVVVAKMADLFGGPLSAVLSAGRGLLDNVALGAANLATKMGASQDGALKLASGISGLGSALPIVGAAAMVGVGIWSMWSAAQEAAKKRAKEFNSTLDEQTGAITENTTAKARSTLEDKHQIDNLNQAGVSVESYTAAIGDNQKALVDQTTVLNALSSTDGDVADRKANLIAMLRAEGGARNDLMATLAENDALDSGLVNTIYDQSNAYDANKKALEERTLNQAIATGKTREQAEAELNAASAAKQNAEAIKEASDATRAAVDPYFAALDATQKLKDAQVAAYLASVQYKDGSPEVEAANEAVARAAMSTEASYLALAQQMQANGSTSDDMKAAFQRWVDQGMITQQSANDLMFKFGLLGAKADEVAAKNVAIQVSAPGLYGVTSGIDDLLNKLDAANTKGMARVQAVIASGYGQANIGFATGGKPDNGWFTVGEQGPELAYKDGSSLEIFSNSTSSKMLAGAGSGGGSSTTVVINMPAGSNGDDVVEAIRRYEQRNGTAWRN